MSGIARVFAARRPQRPDSPRARSHRVRTSINTAIVAFASLGVLFPFYLIFANALKSGAQTLNDPLGPPTDWLWGNFSQAWTQGDFGTFIRNSVFVVVPTVLVTLVASLLAAYAFSIRRFRGSTPLFALLMAGLTIPAEILVIPLYYEMVSLGLLNTLWALMLPQMAMSIPFGVLLLRAFIQDIPRDLLDAARLDGCSQFRLLTSVVMPLTRPALFSLLVFTFMWTWNAFLLPLVLVQTQNRFTLPVGLSFFQGRHVTDLPLLMSGVIIAFAPVMLVYVFFQRHIIRGITTGALK